MNSYERYKYEYVDKYPFDRSSSIFHLGDLNNYKSETSISISPIYMSFGSPE